MKKIQGIIDRFEGNKAIISTTDGLIEVPQSWVEDYKESDAVFLTLSSDKQAQAEQEELARNLLNEILKED